MSLDTYSGLKTAVANFLHRSDLTTSIPDFIALAEAQMNRRLRVRRMVTRATADIADGYSASPDDFLGAITFEVDGTRLKFLTPDQMNVAVEGEDTGSPEYYSIVGGEFRFYPTPSDTYTGTLTYWASIPALTDLNTSNWVLENHPDAYLYGALTQAAPYLRDDDRLSTWGTLFTTALDDVETADRAESFGALQALPNGYAY
jgi:hypothetical protein